MKTPSSFLYDLVNKLTKSEKRYIKLRPGDGEKDYLQLMDALLAQEQFDEDQLVKDNQGANFLKYLAVNKRYLYELVLESLTHFGQKKVEDRITEKINAANVLIEKGLLLAALSELRKGQKLVDKYESFELQILLCGIEKRLLASQQFKKRTKNEIHLIFAKERNSLEQLKNTNEYWYLAQQVVQFQTQFQKIQTEEQQVYLSQLTDSPLFQDLSLATNFKSKLFFYQANATYQFMLGNVKEAYQINSQFLDLLETHPHFLRLYAERYLGTLNNMLIDSLVIGEYDVLNEGINRLVKTLQRPEFSAIKNIESRVFRQRYLLLINWSLSQKDFARALKWIPEMEEGLEQFGKKIERHHRITFYYLLAYLLFLNGRYDQALRWNNLLLNDAKEEVVKEIFYFARTLNLLIHYELENYALLESLLLSTPKYLKARRAIYATEKALFRFLGKLLNAINKKEKQQLYANFTSKVNDLFQRPSEQRVFNYLDLRLWMEQFS